MRVTISGNALRVHDEIKIDETKATIDRLNHVSSKDRKPCFSAIKDKSPRVIAFNVV